MKESIFYEDMVLINDRVLIGSNDAMAAIVAHVFECWPSAN